MSPYVVQRKMYSVCSIIKQVSSIHINMILMKITLNQTFFALRNNGFRLCSAVLSFARSFPLHSIHLRCESINLREFCHQ